MSYSGDAAEQVVRISLNGAEVAARLSGRAAKEIAVLLYAVLKDQTKTKGKTRLSNMLRSGKELKVFAVKDSELEKFCIEAKKYGVLYCVLRDKNASDGITDIMVRAEDASKINRIFERFGLASVDMASVRAEISQAKEAPPRREEKTEESPNPTQGPAARSRQSEPISTPREEAEPDASDSHPSVRQELKDIRAEQKVKSQGPEPERFVEHIAPKRKVRGKER